MQIQKILNLHLLYLIKVNVHSKIIKLSSYQVIKLSSYQVIKLSSYQVIKLSSYQVINKFLIYFIFFYLVFSMNVKLNWKIKKIRKKHIF